MNPVDRYIANVLQDLFGTEAEKRRFAADLQAHFDEGASSGETPAQVIERLGRHQDVAAAFNGERPLHYAGFWRRAIAFAGDIGFLAWLNLPIFGVFLWIFPPDQQQADPSLGLMVLLGLLALGVAGTFLCYFPVVEARFGKTIGKHLVRVRVLQESAAPITGAQAFLRRLSFYFDLLAPDAIFIPFTSKKQRALDIVAKTIVVKEPGDEAPWWSYAFCILLPVSVAALLGSLVTILAHG